MHIMFRAVERMREKRRSFWYWIDVVPRWHVSLPHTQTHSRSSTNTSNQNQLVILFTVLMCVRLFYLINKREKLSRKKNNICLIWMFSMCYFFRWNIHSRAIPHSTFRKCEYLMATATSTKRQTKVTAKKKIVYHKTVGFIVICLRCCVCFGLKAAIFVLAVAALQRRIIIHVNAASHCTWTLAHEHNVRRRKKKNKRKKTADGNWLHEPQRFQHISMLVENFQRCD